MLSLPANIPITTDVPVLRKVFAVREQGKTRGAIGFSLIFCFFCIKTKEKAKEKNRSPGSCLTYKCGSEEETFLRRGNLFIRKSDSKGQIASLPQ